MKMHLKYYFYLLERHYARLEKMMQQIMFVDFTWNNMKLEEKLIDDSIEIEK